MVFTELFPPYSKRSEMKKLSKISVLVLIVLAFFNACTEKSETPVKGKLTCYVDESLFKLIEAERDSFVARYKLSKIDLVPLKAREGIASLLNNESTVFISSRNLNDEEKKYLDQIKQNMSSLRAFKFCYDAVVPVVSESNSSTDITTDEIRNILSGKIAKFKIFLPEQNSGIYEYLKDKFTYGKELKNVFIVKSEEEVIQKIKDVKNSLGFVGLNIANNKKDVKVLEVGVVRSDGEPLNYMPYVAYLVSQTYPLTRTTAILINDPAIGVASGFVSFLTSYEGQRIVSKNNLGPATVPVKMVELNRR
jgi:phosphate transport system substrate-binding protein